MHLAKLSALAEAAKAGKIITTKRCGITCEPRYRMYCLSGHMYIHMYIFERNIVENSEVSRLLIESAGENSLLNEHSRTVVC